MKLVVWGLWVGTAWLVLCGCATAPTSRRDPGPQGQVAQSSQPRLAAPNVAAGDLAQLTADNSAFALDLFHVLSSGSGNWLDSPYSLSLALIMAYNGARGETARQMSSTMHLGLPPDRLNPAFGHLDLNLAARGEGVQNQEAKGFRLNLVNAIWGQTGYAFLPQYLDLLAAYYGAGLRLVDFEHAVEPARATINQWVSDQTAGKIPDLLGPRDVNSTTRLVLTNAVYFNAAWGRPIDKAETADGPFHLLDGSQVTVPMMHQTDWFEYAQGQGYQAIELPYRGNELAMLLLLPAAGQYPSFENALSAPQLATILKRLAPTRVVLTMPRFKFSSSFNLNDALKTLGMRDAFQYGPADFSGMDGTRTFYIGATIHKAFISVDEAGTEASAATALVILPGAAPVAPVSPIPVTLDRPFIFLIRDRPTGVILFSGCVLNPGA